MDHDDPPRAGNPGSLPLPAHPAVPDRRRHRPRRRPRAGLHPEQGWSLLCNGIVLFEDFGELLPDGQSCGARRHELLMASPHRRAS